MIDVRVVVLQGAVEAAAEALGEGLVVDEELVFRWMVEGVVFGMEGDSGDDEVDVGMVLDLAAPGVQDAGEAEARAFVFGGADVLQGGGALFEKERVEDLGLGQTEGAKAVDGLVEGCGSELALILKVDEEVEHTRRGQRGKILIGEVTAELANPAVVTQAAALGEAFELDEAGEVLIPRSRRECVIFFS